VLPERVGVVEGENALVFPVDPDLLGPGQYPAAIKITSSRFQLPPPAKGSPGGNRPPSGKKEPPSGINRLPRLDELYGRPRSPQAAPLCVRPPQTTPGCVRPSLSSIRIAHPAKYSKIRISRHQLAASGALSARRRDSVYREPAARRSRTSRRSPPPRTSRSFPPPSRRRSRRYLVSWPSAASFQHLLQVQVARSNRLI
jgi:hypothetical protein